MTLRHNDHYHPFLLRQVPAGCRRALDVGCGTGTFAALLARSAAEVDAVDRSAEMIAFASRRGAHTPNVRYTVADLRDFALDAGRYTSSPASPRSTTCRSVKPLRA